MDVSVTSDNRLLLYGNAETSTSLAEAENIRGIRLDKQTLSIEIGQSERLSVIFDAEDNANRAIAWHSSDERIAEIYESGEVKALQTGEAILTATTASGNYAAVCTVTVTHSEPTPEPTPAPVTDETLNLTSATLEKEELLQLIATVIPSDADDTSVRWSSSDTAIASVDDKGLVRALSPGNATITVVTNDGDLSATCEIVVNALPTSIEAPAERRIVYPRIVKDRLFLNLLTAQTVYLIDANGRIVKAFQAPTGETVLPMGDLQAGIYWIRLTDQAISIIKE